MIELIIKAQQQTPVNKMRLDIFVLFNIFNYCRIASYSEFAFHCFNEVPKCKLGRSEPI